MRNLKNDASVSAFVAGLIVVLVGMTSSAVIVFQAAQAAGVTASEASSWLGSLCIGMGILTLGLSIYYKSPVLIAWSTPGAALIVSGTAGLSINEVIGAFTFSAFLIFLSGVTGFFAKIMNRIPVAIASALLAGVLLHFSLDSFIAFENQPMMVGLMCLSYVVGKRFLPRFTMMIVLVVGVVSAVAIGSLHIENVHLVATNWRFVMPEFSWKVLLSLGVPLFVVTMASQNLTGFTVMRANGYETPVSPLMSWTGFINMLTSPFGGFAINLAAITAAIGMGPEAHPNFQKRYFSGVVSGLLYIFIGIFAGAVTSVFAAFPKELIMSIAGLALLTTISSALQKALAYEHHKEAAFITFAVAASGVTILGVAAAFWALIAGTLTQIILNYKKSI